MIRPTTQPYNPEEWARYWRWNLVTGVVKFAGIFLLCLMAFWWILR